MFSKIEGNVLEVISKNKTRSYSGNHDKKLLTVESHTGSGKSYSIQQIIIKAIEDNSNEVIVVLLQTLSEIQDFYKLLIFELEKKKLPRDRIVKRTSKNRLYPAVSPLNEEEIDFLSRKNVKNISLWLKRRLLIGNSLEVFLMSSVYAEGKNNSCQKVTVWNEVLTYIRFKKQLAPTTCKCSLFLDEADRFIRNKLFSSIKSQ